MYGWKMKHINCVEREGHVVVQTVQSLEVEVRGSCQASKYRFENYGKWLSLCTTRTVVDHHLNTKIMPHGVCRMLV
jgi:hypothetical protein